MISEHTMTMLDEVDKYFPMKPSSMGPPKIYLGAKIGRVQLRNGMEMYSMSMSQYVQKEAVKNVKGYIAKKGMAILKNAATSLSTNYSPEIDQSEELEEEEAKCHQSLIGILRWIVEMGWMVTRMEVSAMLSLCQCPERATCSKYFAYLSN